LLTVIGRAIDAAVISGAGGAGQPQGIVGSPGIGTQSGTTLADAGLREMARLVEAAGTTPTGWISGPGAAKTLRGRERAAGSGMNWDAGQILGLPAVATAACTTDTVVLADWRQLVMAFWGSGIEISANPFQGFASGVTSLRVMASVDVGLAHPGAFVVSTSVT
jgi:HK97 family phage major capsid protein